MSAQEASSPPPPPKIEHTACDSCNTGACHHHKERRNLELDILESLQVEFQAKLCDPSITLNRMTRMGVLLRAIRHYIQHLQTPRAPAPSLNNVT